MTALKVAVDVSSAVSGGGVTYLRHMIPRLVEHPRLELGPVLVRAGVSSVRSIMSGLPTVEVDGRAGGRSSAWGDAIKAAKPDVAFAPTEVSFARYEQPLVLALRNPCLDPKVLWEYPLRWRARQAIFRRWARHSGKRAAAHVAVSNYAKDLGVSNLGLSESRVRVIHHGGPPMPEPRAAGSISNFLFVSDLYRYKNLHRLLEALGDIDANWNLKVVGWPLEPAYMAQLEEIVTKKGLSNRVDFLGRQKPDAVAALYAESDCLVWPSYGETFGHPLLEARSHGLPVISARAASNAEIAGDAAVYFSTFEVDDLRRVLVDALNHGIVPGELPRSYGWDRCADETAMLLTEVA